MKIFVKTGFGMLALLVAPSGLSAQQAGIASELSWRSIGPARSTGRVVDLAVDPYKPSTFYVASATGGLWKTENMGTTFKCVFEKGAISIGDVAVSPADPRIVWVGTGEANNQRSSYRGTGIWVSRDAGKTWSCTGLAEGHHVGRIAPHPQDPLIAYAAVVGHLYTENKERGLYKTIDGGKTWKLVKYLGPKVGFIDVVVDPRNPEVVYAASYERIRRAWNYDGSGEGSRIWKSADGGKTWKMLAGGLPGGKLGRIGLAIYPKDPRILYACIQNFNIKPKTAVRRGRPGTENMVCQVYRTDDGGVTWKKVNVKPESVTYNYYFGQIRVDPVDPDRVWLLSTQLWVSGDGGKTWKPNGAPGCHVDHHALWIDPSNPEHLILGNDGGLYMSWSRGKSWDWIGNLPITQVYALTADNRDPYVVYFGTQDDGSWGTVSATGGRSGIPYRFTFGTLWGDGFYSAVDPVDPNTLYAESQFGGLARVDILSGGARMIKPRSPRGYPPLRFNWMSPLVISPHNPRILYFGSQYLHRSLDRGDHWQVISPDLTTNDKAKLRGNVPHCTITTISESPLKPGLIWVGTDDGKVQVTLDGGAHWRDLSGAFPGDVRKLWVSRVEASHFDPAVAFVAYNGYREDDFRPLLYMTSDYGATWTPIANDLPAGPINVVRQDPRAKDLLFVGSDAGVFFSLDSGGSWTRLDKGMPDVACHDLYIHPREKDLIAGTHGRGVFILDITPLEALGAAAPRAARGRPGRGAFPFKVLLGVRPSKRIYSGPSRSERGQQAFYGQNPLPGTVIWYRLPFPAGKGVEVEVADAAGNTLWKTKAPGTAGLHKVVWSGRRSRRSRPRGAAVSRGAGGTSRRAGRGRQAARTRRAASRPSSRPSRPGRGRPPGAPGRGRPFFFGGSRIPEGDYVVKIKAGRFTESRVFHFGKRVKVDVPRVGL